MINTSGNPSVPLYRRAPERELTAPEREVLHDVADALIPPRGELAAPSATAGYDKWLDRALAARGDAFDAVIAAAMRFVGGDPASLRGELKAFSENDPNAFHLLSSVVAGAYLMVPAVRAAIGYPGQRRHHPQFDEAANQIMDGILDPVIARGPIYTPVEPLAGGAGAPDLG